MTIKPVEYKNMGLNYNKSSLMVTSLIKLVIKLVTYWFN